MKSHSDERADGGRFWMRACRKENFMNGEEEEEEKEMEGETIRRAGRRVSTGERHVHKSKPVC